MAENWFNKDINIMKHILALIILLFVALPVNAVNFTYKVYDQRTNKAYTAQLGTVGVNRGQYLFAFFTLEGKELCILGEGLTPIDVRNELVGGICLPREIIMNARDYVHSNNLTKNVLGWREFSQNTFYAEIDDIRKERSREGYTELKFDDKDSHIMN